MSGAFEDLQVSLVLVRMLGRDGGVVEDEKKRQCREGRSQVICAFLQQMSMECVLCATQ